jgi:peptidoglycan/xylan/chitin deacetylase (PgdA/CDA1 family)
VLTHDVERAGGYEIVDEVMALEAQEGLRSAWYFVPERDYRVDDALVGRLWERGFEVCVHGLHHDGRDLQPGVFEKRLPAMRSYAERWGSVGFRSPSTQRSRDVIAALRCDHDSSYSDVARFEPQGGGSCSWLPFFVDDVVELPITMPMDHTLFELLGHTDERIWIEKAEFLRDRGGMALMLTHPDYLREDTTRASYSAFLARVARDQTAWQALPREVSDWWRRRAASSLRWDRDTWVVEGPAPEARVVSSDRPGPFV